MIFSRTQLINTVKGRIHALEQKAFHDTQKAREKYLDDEKAWLARWTPRYREFIAIAEGKLDQGQPVTSEDIEVIMDRRGNGYSPAVARFDHKVPDAVEAKTDRLKTLLAALESATSDTISQTNIEKMGYKLTEIFVK